MSEIPYAMRSIYARCPGCKRRFLKLAPNHRRCTRCARKRNLRSARVRAKTRRAKNVLDKKSSSMARRKVE